MDWKLLALCICRPHFCRYLEPKDCSRVLIDRFSIDSNEKGTGSLAFCIARSKALWSGGFAGLEALRLRAWRDHLPDAPGGEVLLRLPELLHEAALLDELPAVREVRQGAARAALLEMRADLDGEAR